MGFDSKTREKIWKRYHPNKNGANDCFGLNMTINDFEVDHIYPESKGGKNAVKNCQPLSSRANKEKDNKLSGKINGKNFKVKHLNGIGVMTVDGKKVTI